MSQKRVKQAGNGGCGQHVAHFSSYCRWSHLVFSWQTEVVLSLLSWALNIYHSHHFNSFFCANKLCRVNWLPAEAEKSHNKDWTFVMFCYASLLTAGEDWFVFQDKLLNIHRNAWFARGVAAVMCLQWKAQTLWISSVLFKPVAFVLILVLFLFDVLWHQTVMSIMSLPQIDIHLAIKGFLHICQVFALGARTGSFTRWCEY